MPPLRHTRRMKYKLPLDVYPSLIMAHLFNGAVVASDGCRPLPRSQAVAIGAYVAHQIWRESSMGQIIAASGVLECAAVAVFGAGHGFLPAICCTRWRVTPRALAISAHFIPASRILLIFVRRASTAFIYKRCDVVIFIVALV